MYWKYETFLKLQEAAIGAMLGAHGQIYAVRRALYPFPDASIINDDYVIPLRVLEAGHRVIYEPEAVVYEDAQEMSGFGRRVRVASGNLQQLGEIGRFLRPLRPRLLFTFISHKALRLVVPAAMIVALAANIPLAGQPDYRELLWLQAAFYAVAALGAVSPLKPRVLRLPYYFCMINAATCVAAWYAVTARRRVAWE